MIDLYTWTTPNGRKPIILLEELGWEYRLKPVNLGAGEQKQPGFVAVNPNGKIPALIDEVGTPDEVKVFESGAILLHLADKSGKFLARGGQARADGLAWLFFQVGAVGPMFGQLGHFAPRKEQDAYAFERYRAEVERLTQVLDGRLGEAAYLAGEYGIADMATYPWVSALARFGMQLETFPNVKRWCDAIAARPAVEKAMNLKMP
jgi:GSH-dependent disulfide-bond oxidoreductase